MVTTIFEPSEAIIKQAKLDGWCLCVVGDKKTPAKYEMEADEKKYVYLTVEKQERIAKTLPISASLPWNHFGRKNIGFLYAIQHGAEVIWDFDDDNEMIQAEELTRLSDIKGPKGPNSTKTFFEALYPGKSKSLQVSTEARSIWPTTCGLSLNPYIFMGANVSGSVWPRGFPLDCIHSASASNVEIKNDIEVESIGIIQSLANHDPDVDAIFRLTQPLPFDFKGASINNKLPLVSMQNTYLIIFLLKLKVYLSL